MLGADEQTEAWKAVTKSVHAAGGKIYCQLWHMGRAGHSDCFAAPPLAPSALPLEGEVTATNHEKKPYETPEAFTLEQIQTTVEDYRKAAANAMTAGFDGCQCAPTLRFQL